MAKKLSDDHLRIILDVEAKGVQAELQKISSSTIQLAEANKTMNKEMRNASNQMTEAEKEMQKLEKAGKTYTAAYQEAKATVESVKNEIADYKTKIEANTKAIAENEKQTAEIIKTMKLEDMTMSQLRQHAADLQKQMNNTSQSLSPEAYKALESELNKVKDRMGVVNNANKNMLQQFAGMHNPVGSAARAVQGFGQALKLLLANPVVAIIAAVVAIFFALRDALFKNEEAMHSLNRIMAPFKILFDGLVNVLQEAVLWILKFVESFVNGISKMIDRVPFLNKLLGGVNEKIKEGAQLERDKQTHELQSRKNMEENAKKETQIAKLRNEAKRKDLYTDQERLDKLNKAVRLEKEISATKVAETKETLRLLEAEAKRTKNATGLERKLSEARVAVENANKEYYTTTMRLQSEISSTTLEIQRERLEQQETADKALLEALTKGHENQLKLLDSSRNKRLEQLQEQETDQKLYALRAAEIESETAKEREGLIRTFGQALEKAEFKNSETRLKAIEENSKKIIDSEAETLKEQANFRKLFAKTTADFERQYNIKTWEQRKADELAILQRQYEEKLLSEETYQLALQALEKKYENEKLKVRQQYGLVSMRESFNSEMEILREQYDKKLLSEEEFQQAQLQIKLKYAQQYAQEAEQFIQAGSNAVKAIEEAETAKLDTEYAKRQSALTEQYNQGIISQEEYNTKKEQLDYEQKSKELEIQKKYADVNFAMQVAQIAATTAQGIITAWATSMTLGPVAGPIAAAALTALLGITSAAQIAKAKAERDRVKSMTLESAGVSGSAPKTGQIRLREGFAEGGFNEASDGGYTGAGGKYDIAGYVPYHRGEYIIAREELRQPAIMDMARAIERERRKRTGKNKVSGFAEGGSNSPAGYDSAVIDSNGHVMSRMLAILQRLEDGGITVQTNYGITEMEAEQRRKQEAESKFTKNEY